MSDALFNLRHAGESRHPVLAWMKHLDPGFRRGDDRFHYSVAG